MDENKTEKRRFQFTIRDILLLTTGIAVSLGLGRMGYTMSTPPHPIATGFMMAGGAGFFMSIGAVIGRVLVNDPVFGAFVGLLTSMLSLILFGQVLHLK